MRAIVTVIGRDQVGIIAAVCWQNAGPLAICPPFIFTSHPFFLTAVT